MIYELIIEDEKAKSVIAFLKQLDFVKIYPKVISAKKGVSKKADITSLSYFDTCPNWDADARSLRHNGVAKRESKW